VLTRDVFATLVRAGLKTLCFTLSRKTAEFVASLALDDRRGEALPVAPYRAGYLPDERRRLERGFREGTWRGLVSTNALELGIDVGDLDAVVVSGYPGSVSSFWQQAGRAGRRGEPSLAVFVAFEGILDQYLLRHPEVLLDRTWERATVDLLNDHIVVGHLLCAASELPVPDPGQVQPEAGAIAALAKAGLLHRTPAGWVYAGTTRPHEAVRLDGVGHDTIALQDAEDVTLLETLDLERAQREAFPNAVYLHQAKTWLVESLDLDGRVARLRRKDMDWYTQSLSEKRAEVLDTAETFAIGPATASRGRIRMVHRVKGYLVKRRDRVVGAGDLDFPERAFETAGLWLDLEPPPTVCDEDDRQRFLGALHALEHTIVGIAPLALSCDPADLAGFSTLLAPHRYGPSLFVYDGHAGGIGLADRAFWNLERILSMARDVLARCPCTDGCPACCLSARCGSNNEPMDKAGAAQIARMLTGR
jgi:DEAD/DEAH box helicase domain-containing protein